MMMQVLVLGFTSALLLGAGSASVHRLELSRHLHDCRTTAFQIQMDLASALSTLMKMNPTAIRLENESRHLKAQLAANPDPATKAVVAGRLAVVTAKQVALKSQQMTVQSEGRLLAQSQIGLWQTRQSGQPKPGVAKLAVIPQMVSIAPAYKPDPDFTNQQRLELQVERDGTEWIRCGATIRTRGTFGGTERSSGWEISLNVGRPSWRPH